MLTGEFLRTIRQDIFNVLLELKKRRKVYTSIYELAADIYEIYHTSHSSNADQDLLFLRRMLTLTYNEINAIPQFFTDGIDEADWVQFHSWNLDNPDHDRLCDLCSVRFYLNLKYEYMRVALKGLLIRFLRARLDKPIMFKFYSPNINDLAKANMADKVVFYVHPDLVDFFSDAIKKFSEDYFYPMKPMFTKEVRPGVGIAFETKKRFAFLDFVSRITQGDINRFSYGTYMAFILSRAFVLLLAKDGTGNVKNICFSNFDENYLNKLVPRTMSLISKRMREDLEMDLE